MNNPWKEISLSDYENHMKLSSVMQLQGINQLMKGQFADSIYWIWLFSKGR